MMRPSSKAEHKSAGNERQQEAISDEEQAHDALQSMTGEGYVNSVSWFRTHPPFYQRMVQSEREIMFLEPKPEAITQTAAFEQMKRALAPIAAQAEKEEIGKPSFLITRDEGCEPPKKLEYRADQPIEELCAALPQVTESRGSDK